jgi:hypothetical protein
MKDGAHASIRRTRDFTEVTGVTAEANLLAAGGNWRPTLPALTFDKDGKGKRYKFVAKGILSADTTRTFTFEVSLGTSTTWSSSDTDLAVSAAITSANVSNRWWRMEVDFVCRTPGAGSNNMTLQADGYVISPTGFASPFIYPLEASTPETATWTLASFDGSVTYYLGLSVTPSNSACHMTVKDAYLLRFN